MMYVLIIVSLANGVAHTSMQTVKRPATCDAAGKAAIQMIHDMGGEAKYLCMKGE